MFQLVEKKEESKDTGTNEEEEEETHGDREKGAYLSVACCVKVKFWFG